MESFKKLEAEINKVKDMNWVKAVSNNRSAVGVTFEKLLGRDENSLEIPDFEDIEIKTKLFTSSPNVLLFSATPDSYLFEIKRLYNKYGYPCKNDKNLKSFTVSIYCNKLTFVNNKYYFTLNIDKVHRKIDLEVYDIHYNLIDNQTAWSFDMLETKLNRKFKKLALIYARKKIVNNSTFFKYEKAIFYKLKSFNDFIDLISKGKIRINFKICTIGHGAKYGQLCDHGTGFEINSNYLEYLFKKIK